MVEVIKPLMVDVSKDPKNSVQVELALKAEAEKK